MTAQRLRLKVLPAATRRTKEQADYYRLESGLALAARWRAAVNATLRSLREMPERGAPCDFANHILHDIRWLPIEGFPKYMAFYRVDPSVKVVLILSILHGARDLERELGMDVSRT